MKKENPKNRPLSVFIETYGCQMNKCDSEIVAGLLTAEGYRLVENDEEADIILINTCSVRDHAEKRALGRIGVLGHWKKNDPHRKLGIIGCMAQRLGKELLSMKPLLDFVVGPDEYRTLPDILTNGRQGPCIRIHLRDDETYGTVSPTRQPSITGWAAITRGCNNFCSYCIVPYTRGRLRSRPAQEILNEVESMAEQGFREVTLLGQNVNAYHNGETDFPDLLKRVSRIPNIFRIRFTTSHPKDLSQKTLEVIDSQEKVCPHIHLPVQSGSNRILALMNRGYTREEYLQRIQKARTYIPGVAITSDILVGFPGETESDFQDTVSLMEYVRFDDAFTYRYSPRPGTKAALMEDNLSEEERLERLDRVIQLQRGITHQKKQQMIDHTVKVLPERVSKQSDEEWMGKTPTNHVVVFPKDDIPLGQPVDVLIEKCKGITLRGNVIRTESISSQSKPGRKPCGS